MDINKLKLANKQRWDLCHIPQDNGPAFKQVADRLTSAAAFDKYKAVENATGVPWWFVAVVHEREASQNWNSYLGNGQPLNKVTTIVPKGRGPFKTWEEGAIDALKQSKVTSNKDWSIGSALTALELYNGPGYANKGVPSPYLWAGTDQYASGKYIADGTYSEITVDKQLGCAGLLKFMGVFKTAPTGLGTVAGVATVGVGATTAAIASANQWPWLVNHWLILTVSAIGAGLLVDLALAIYNNEKNQLKVSNV